MRWPWIVSKAALRRFLSSSPELHPNQIIHFHDLGRYRDRSQVKMLVHLLRDLGITVLYWPSGGFQAQSPYPPDTAASLGSIDLPSACPRWLCPLAQNEWQKTQRN